MSGEHQHDFLPPVVAVASQSAKSGSFWLGYDEWRQEAVFVISVCRTCGTVVRQYAQFEPREEET